MPVGVGIVRERHLVLIFQSDKPGHGIRAGTIHADLTVVIDRHERKRRVNDWIDDDDVESVSGVDRLPIGPRGSAQRVHGEFEVGAANGVHINYVFEIAHVG